MSIDRKIGLELRDGQEVGRDPNQMAHDPAHEDSAVDVCGYAALLRELSESNNPERR